MQKKFIVINSYQLTIVHDTSVGCVFNTVDEGQQIQPDCSMRCTCHGGDLQCESQECPINGLSVLLGVILIAQLLMAVLLTSKEDAVMSSQNHVPVITFQWLLEMSHILTEYHVSIR